MEKVSGVLVEKRLAMRQQCASVAKEAHDILGLLKRGDPPQILYTSGMLCPVPGSQFKKDRELLEGVQRKAIRIIRVVEHFHYEESERPETVQPGKD